MAHVPVPANEPVLSYAPGNPERAALTAAIEAATKARVEIPLVIGGEELRPGEPSTLTCPHRHELEIGCAFEAGQNEVTRAIAAARAAKPAWAALPFEARAAILLRAAELLAGPFRQRVNAATVLNQSKTPHQTEIDAACELIDFFRFNVHFAERIAAEQPVSERGIWNQSELRPLDGFVYAVTPFNFTSIAGNLPTAPALMGNTVVWKPSPLALLSAHHVMELLREAGLPDGVVNLVHGDAAAITRQVLAEPDFAALHFTGSTAVLRGLFTQIGQNIERYRSYPRIVGESGGKDFVVAHPSAHLDALRVALVRGAFEFQGQKCSAASRAYVARSLWNQLEKPLAETVRELSVGDPMQLGVFCGAVIGRGAYDKITGYQRLAKESADCELLVGGGASDERGYFVDPTVVVTRDPKHRLMQEEIFGPVLSVYVYDDDHFDDVLSLVDETSPYALTGAVFARDRAAVERASARLRFAAGNFYVNDKPTGAVVGQQPFGGARMSGTNDKAGAAWNLMRWASPRSIKENLSPPTEWRYPYMGERR